MSRTGTGETTINFCECEQDGYCPWYDREMVGRMREICQGVNVDLGTAAAFREQWLREAGGPKDNGGMPKPILLKTDQAAGDAVAMTAAIYSLHKSHPGKYVTAVESKYLEVFKYNPDVYQGAWPGSILKDFAEVQMHYPAIHQSNQRGIHFMQGWCEFLGAALGVHIPLLTNRPRLYFDHYDYDDPPVGSYWIICSGGKSDFTNKLWGHYNYQRVVSRLKGRVQFIQVGSAVDEHPRLSNVEDMVGKTTLRHLFNLVRRSRGVVCGVSLLMHVAAALEKPAIVIAGGREPVAWNAYPKQHYLHTVGALPCSDTTGYVGGACWRSRVTPIGDDTVLDKDTCELPVVGQQSMQGFHGEQYTEQIIPKCMSMIKPSEVVELILRYNS